MHESLLHSISEALNHHRLPLNLVEPPTVAMPTTGNKLLSHTINIRGATHDPQAGPLIEPFLNHNS